MYDVPRIMLPWPEGVTSLKMFHQRAPHPYLDLESDRSSFQMRHLLVQMKHRHTAPSR